MPENTLSPGRMTRKRPSKRLAAFPLTEILRAGILVALVAGTPACSSNSQPGATPTASTTEEVDACDSLDLPVTSDGPQYQIELSLAAGEEREVCQLVKLDRDIDLNWTDGLYTKGSHHALLQRTAYKDTLPAKTLDGQTLDGTKVHTCETPSALWQTTGILGGGRPVGGINALPLDKGVLPDDVAMKLSKGEYVLLNFHMLNASAKPLTSCYKVNLHGIPAAQVKQEAGILFWYNPFITVPAGGTATARMACPVTQDINLASAVSHAHRRLDGYTAKLLSGDPEMGGTEMQMLYHSTEWDGPVATKFAPAQMLKQGQWIDYQCHYTNPENRNVAQGFQTTDEMCMFIGAYWPRDPNLDFCQDTKTRAALGRVYGDGTKPGADVLSCVQASPKVFTGGGAASSADRYASMSCITQTCPEASGAIEATFNACPSGMTSTPACMTAVSALSAATCNN